MKAQFFIFIIAVQLFVANSRQIVDKKHETLLDRSRSRKPPMGGKTTLTPSQAQKQESYNNAVDYSKANFKDSCKLEGKWKWDKVLEIQQQIVRGIMYYLKVELSLKKVKSDYLIQVLVEPMDNETGKSDISIESCEQSE